MKTLLDYIDVIFCETYSKEEWSEINEKVNKLYNESTSDEIEEFDEAGAGDMLEMFIEYPDRIRSLWMH